MYRPAKGDIVHLQLDPAEGSEMKGPHYGLVLSAREFNALGLAMVCPISQGAAAAARSAGLVVTLMGTGTRTQGAVHCHHLKSMDWRARKAVFVETAPPALLAEVMARLDAVFSD